MSCRGTGLTFVTTIEKIPDVSRNNQICILVHISTLNLIDILSCASPSVERCNISIISLTTGNVVAMDENPSLAVDVADDEFLLCSLPNPE